MKCNYEHGQHILAHTKEFSTLMSYARILGSSIKTYCCSAYPSDYLCLCLKVTKLPQNFQCPQVTAFVRHKTLNHPSLHKVFLKNSCMPYSTHFVWSPALSRQHICSLKYSRKKLVLSRTMNGDVPTA